MITAKTMAAAASNPRLRRRHSFSSPGSRDCNHIKANSANVTVAPVLCVKLAASPLKPPAITIRRADRSSNKAAIAPSAQSVENQWWVGSSEPENMKPVVHKPGRSAKPGGNSLVEK